ncbi:MAG: sulfite exporter TauE/SafE family protein [Pseudomonadaceae bacterium]|nr:MAG: sulfite exporter TauE/SafE family protein [Pseudomonadaceae bacterium]
MEFLLYLILGGFAGTLAGLFGVGGGMIIVPVLIYSFTLQGFDVGVLTHMAVGTSLATIAFTSINAIRAHHLKGAVRWPLFVWMSLGIVFGTVIGAFTAAWLSGPLLQKIIGVFAICLSIQMAFKLQPKAVLDVPGKPGLTAAGGVIGWASAIFGIGGGSLTVPFLVWRSVPMQQAVATSSACGLPIAVAGAISFIWTGWAATPLPEWSVGYVYLPALVGIAATSMLFAGFGARLAHRLSQELLKRLFALLLFGVGINFLFF